MMARACSTDAWLAGRGIENPGDRRAPGIERNDVAPLPGPAHEKNSQPRTGSSWRRSWKRSCHSHATWLGPAVLSCWHPPGSGWPDFYSLSLSWISHDYLLKGKIKCLAATLIC